MMLNELLTIVIPCKNEKEMHQTRPVQSKILDGLQRFFELVQGESFESSGGYTTSFGVGWWV